MTTTRSAEELAAPLGSVDMARLVFVRGAAHLTIGVDGSMRDLYRVRFEYRARFEGKAARRPGRWRHGDRQVPAQLSRYPR